MFKEHTIKYSNKKIYPVLIKQKSNNLLILIGPYGYKVIVLTKRLNFEINYNTKVFNVITNKYYKDKELFVSYCSIIFNNFRDIANGYMSFFYLKGTGFRGYVSNNKFILRIGYSHAVIFPIPKDIIICPNLDKLKKTTHFSIFGLDIQHVYETLSSIKRLKIKDAYKGKGIFEIGENIILKERKKAVV